MDQISVKRIQSLHPKLRAEALVILGEIEQKLTGRAMCRITYTLRTMSEQKALYEQGRSTKGPIVTNAKPGYSFHNYGLAIDFAFVIDGKTASWDHKADWDNDKKADWMEVVEVFKRYGWEWGGDWKTFLDMPHFQKTFGYSTTKLRELHNAGKIDKDGYVLI
jgi:peptidoglycan L-alanyl-D-glutamate endopeptidase CwlK